jgi:hypothetical protein
MATVIGYTNRIDSATLSGGSWNASYPLANLKTRYLSQKARSTNAQATSSIVNIDLTTARSIGLVAIVAHNMSASATVRIQGSSAADQSVSLYDSTAQTIYSGTDYAKSFANVSTRYWRISIADTGNTAGYIEFGRVFIGTAFKPSNTIDWSPSLAVESATGITASLGGTEYFDARPNKRIWGGQFSWLSDAESYGEWLRVQRATDVSGEVFIVADDADTTYRAERNFLGRLRTLGPIEYPYLNQYTTAVEIGEVL